MSKGVAVCVFAVLGLGAGSGAAQETATGPELFAVDVLNTPADEYGPVLSPDGTEMYFTVRRNRRGSEYLVRTEWTGDGWSEPTQLAISGRWYDKEPYLSPDGTKLFFASQRPVPSGESLDFEFWVSERDGDGWGEPRHVPELGSAASDNYPAVASSGNVYFGSARIEGRGRIFRAVWDGSAFAEPEALLTVDGTQLDGADPYIDPAERFMVFSSTRSGGFGEGDLYLTVRGEAGWSEPLNLGPVINTETYEFTPFISPDGDFLYFSRGWGEMWRIRVSEVAPLAELVEAGR